MKDVESEDSGAGVEVREAGEVVDPAVWVEDQAVAVSGWLLLTAAGRPV